MSYHYYLVDDEEKLVIDAGNYAKDYFEEDFEVYKKFRDFINDFNEIELEKITIKNLNLQNLKRLIDCYEILERLNCINSRILALEYKYLNQDKDLPLVGEDQLEKYKGYKIIC